MPRTAARLAALLAAAALAGAAFAQTRAGVPLADEATAARPLRMPDVIFVPTPQEVVDAMLRMANVTRDDVLFDLGSGDGRIVITAAQRYGTRGTGIDIDPERVQEAIDNAKAAGVKKLVRFRNEDLFAADLRDATVVTLYLLPELNRKLAPKLLAELRPGARIVSHQFDMGSWKPDREATVAGRKIYLWVVPPRQP
ncbi:MAG: class I SAM-dependent methyltransferase [Burkholderiales bacterium]|nr:class I SAM-dependent methyltransferase [Burkholderiales bacterium]